MINEIRWQDALSNALATAEDPLVARFFQLATVADGAPRNRTVVFRGFRADDALLIATDARSSKVKEVLVSNKVEVCWYFMHSREQFRIRCDASVFQADSIDQADRRRVWEALSARAREQFFGPAPGVPFDDQAKLGVALDVEGESDAAEAIPATFAILSLTPIFVDYLELAEPHKRLCWSQVEGVWQSLAVTP